MTGSNKPRASIRRGGLLALGLTLSLTVSVSAQEPVRTAPLPLLPAPQADPAAPPTASPLTPAISVNALERVSADRVGLMDESNGALPNDMWDKSDPAFVRAILAQLPHSAPSPAMRRLAQHLLLPPAREPRVRAQQPLFDNGAPMEAAPAETPWLLEARINALAAMGDWPNALALLELVPAERITPALIKLRIDGLLIEGKTDAACGAAQAQLANDPDPHWQKIQVYCQFAGQQASAAQLGLSLLREQGLDDPEFFWAADVLQGAKAPAPAITALPALELVMLRAAGQPFPDSLLKGADATTLRVAATMTAAAPAAEDAKLSADEKKKRTREQQDARVLLAERALALGMIAPDVVVDLYLKLDLSQEPPTAPLAQVTAETVRARAYMYRLAKTQTVPPARAEVIARVIDLARAGKGAKGLDLVTVGRIYAPLLAEFTPGPDLIWFAGHAARGLLAAGQPDKAAAWIDLAQQMARGAREAAMVADGLWPLVHIADPESQDTVSTQQLRAWQAALPSGAAAPLREDLLNTLMALGDRIPAVEWLPVLGSPPTAATVATASPAVWHGLTLAAREQRVGDVAALSLVALGEAGPYRVSPLTLNKVIESLMAAGREADARNLAVEAALVQGL